MSREAYGFALDGVLPRRTSDVSMADSLKLGTARSRIRIGEESNGFPALAPLETKSAKTTPCTVGMLLKSLMFVFAQKAGSERDARPTASSRPWAAGRW